MSRAHTFCLVALLVAAMGMGGCSSSAPPISVSLSPSSPQAIDQGQTVAITATVTNDPSYEGVSWSLTGPGSLRNTTTLFVTYNSPTTSLTSAERAVVTATSVKDTTKTGALAINGFLSIQINPTAPPANPVPFLNQPLVPTAVAPGSNGLTLSVGGTGFVSAATVNFNRAPLTTTFVDTEHLTAMVPAADVANAGTAEVTVVNPAPGGGSSNVVYFQIGAPEATVNFVNASNSPLKSYSPDGLAMADFNEDGKPDLAIAASIWVYVLLGNGDGTFASASGSPFKVESPPALRASTGPSTICAPFGMSSSGA